LNNKLKGTHKEIQVFKKKKRGKINKIENKLEAITPLKTEAYNSV
jgi:hypothetical protein